MILCENNNMLIIYVLAQTHLHDRITFQRGKKKEAGEKTRG